MIEVMPVDRTDVIEAKLLEQRTAGEEAARVFFDAQRFLGGELELEDGRVLSFQIQDGAVGAQASVIADNPRNRT